MSPVKRPHKKTIKKKLIDIYPLDKKMSPQKVKKKIKNDEILPKKVFCKDKVSILRRNVKSFSDTFTMDKSSEKKMVFDPMEEWRKACLKFKQEKLLLKCKNDAPQPKNIPWHSPWLEKPSSPLDLLLEAAETVRKREQENEEKKKSLPQLPSSQPMTQRREKSPPPLQEEKSAISIADENKMVTKAITPSQHTVERVQLPSAGGVKSSSFTMGQKVSPGIKRGLAESTAVGGRQIASPKREQTSPNAKGDQKVWAETKREVRSSSAVEGHEKMSLPTVGKGEKKAPSHNMIEKAATVASFMQSVPSLPFKKRHKLFTSPKEPKLMSPPPTKDEYHIKVFLKRHKDMPSKWFVHFSLEDDCSA